MAQVTIQIPDGVMSRVIDAFAATYGYQDTIPNPDFDPAQPEDPTTNPTRIANPQTKAQFARRRIIEYVKGVVTQHESTEAAAIQADTTDSEVVIT